MHAIASRTLYAAAALVLAAAGSVPAAEQTVRGTKLVIVDPGSASGRKLTCVATEKNSASTLVGDPTVDGAVLEVTTDGGTPAAQSFSLPQGTSSTGRAFWSGDAEDGYRYLDARGDNGPVTSLTIKRTNAGTFALKTKISGKYGAVDIVPPNPGTDACLALSLGGGDRYSVDFGASASVSADSTRRFVAKSPTLAAVCDPVAGTTTTTTTGSGGTTTTTTIASGSCPTANFLDVASAPGAGAGYPAPTLSVSCSGSQVTVTSNGIPHYTFVSVTPNGLSAGNFVYTFPLNPQVAASATSLPLLGNIGVAVNGMTITGPNEAAFPDPYGDPVANAITDQCSGHTAPGGAYHDHALVQKCLVPSGLVSQPWNNPDPTGNERSPILGYALDGFAIYGPYECTDSSCASIYEALSGWDNVGYQSLDCTSSAQCGTNYTCATAMIAGVERKACIPKTYAWNNNQYSAKAGSEYLDQCNGHVGPFGDYHYHATAAFPYTLGCYRGTPY